MGSRLRHANSANMVPVIVGLVVAVLAAVKLWLLHQGPPRITAPR
jgi:hypothetical protein